MQEITHLEFELSSKCNAACPQCPREDPNIKDLISHEKNEITLENVIAWFPENFLKNLKQISFRGTYSEPIIAKDFYPIIEYLINQTTANIKIHTNGSLRKLEFWAELGKLLTNRGTIIFGIDGLKDTHNIYRVNTDYEKIINNATEFIAHGGKATWQYIIFSHNEHQIEKAKQLASKIGFKNFLLISSPRFESSKSFEINKAGQILKKSENYVSTTWNEVRENIHQTKNINCESNRIGWIVVDWNGEVFPCCWSQIWKRGIKNMRLDSEIWYKKVVKEPNNTNLNNKNIYEILEQLEIFYNNLGKKYIPGVCAWNCGNNKIINYNKKIEF